MDSTHNGNNKMQLLAGSSGATVHQTKRRTKVLQKVGSPNGTVREIDAGLVIAGHRYVRLQSNSNPGVFVNVTWAIKIDNFMTIALAITLFSISKHMYL